MPRTATLAKPDLQYLLDLRREMEMLYRDDDNIIDAMRAVRTLTSKIRLDDKYRITDVEFHDPSVFDEIQRVAASLSLNPPKWKVKTRPAGGSKMEHNASNREEWTANVFHEAGTREQGHDAFRDCVDAACEGGAWSRFIFKNDVWEQRWRVSIDLESKDYNKKTEEAKKEAGQPFLWDCIDVRTLYPIFSGTRLAEILIVNKRPRNAAMREYRLKQLSTGEIVPEGLGTPMNIIDQRSVGPWVYTLEHWDDTWYSFAIQDSIISSYDGVGNPSQFGAGPNGRAIDQIKHGYRRVPFFFAPGYVINWQHGRKIGWGIAESKRWLVEFREYLMTLYAQLAARDLGKVVVRTRTKGALVQSVGDDRQTEDREYFEPFQVLTAEDGETYDVLDFGGGGESIQQMIEYVSKLIEQLMAPRIATDIGGSDPGSGFAIAQIIAETQVKEDPIVQNVQNMLKEMTKFCWQLVRDKVHETVWVQSDQTPDGWLGMDEADLAPGVNFDVLMDPERASAKLVEHNDLHTRMEKQTIGRHQAIEKMGDVNADDVDDDIAIDRIESTQWYIARHDKQLMQEMDRGDILYKAAKDVIGSGQLPGMGNVTGMSIVGQQPVPAMGPGQAMAQQAGQLGAAGSVNPGPAPTGLSPITPGEMGTAVNPQGPSGAGAVVGGMR